MQNYSTLRTQANKTAKKSHFSSNFWFISINPSLSLSHSKQFVPSVQGLPIISRKLTFCHVIGHEWRGKSSPISIPLLLFWLSADCDIQFQPLLFWVTALFSHTSKKPAISPITRPWASELWRNRFVHSGVPPHLTFCSNSFRYKRTSVISCLK